MVDAEPFDSTSGARLAPLKWALLLFIVAAAIRFGYLAFEVAVPAQDTHDYDEIAANLLAGKGFVSSENWFGYEMRSWRAPLYPGFMAGIYGLIGYSHTAVKVVQAIFGSMTVVILFAIARTIFPPASVVAGLGAALYMPLVVNPNELMTETLFTFFFILSVYLMLEKQVGAQPGMCRNGHWLTTGMVIGLAALTRPVALILWPLEILLSRPVAVSNFKVWIFRCLWISLGVIATVAPWTARNYNIHGSLVPISTHGGFIFARSNGPNPDWKKIDGWQIDRQTFDLMPNEVERDRYWLGQGWQYVVSDPGHFARLSLERFVRLWYFFRPDYNFSYMVLLPLFLAGFWQFRTKTGFDTLAVIIIAFVCTFSIFLYGSVRFRLPLEPLFILFASAFITDAWQRWGGRLVATVLAILIVANGLVWWQEKAARTLLLNFLAFGKFT